IVSQLLPSKASLMAFTDNDGGIDGQAPGDWTPSQGSGINSGVDHQTVGMGPFVPGLPDGTTAYANAVYYASQDIAVAELALSRDGGLTFGPAVPMYNLTQCSGLHGHIQVTPDGPQKGTVYVPNKGCAGKQGVAVSEDEGITFAVRTVPNSTPGDTDPAAGVDKSGRVYFGYTNGDGRARMAVSTDRGQTWTDDQDIGAQLGIRNAVFASVVAGDAGRAAFTFIGTTTGGNYNDATFPGVWHVYVAHTFDGGVTWQLLNATPNNPVQRGDICTSGTSCATGGLHRNLLDFYDVQVDRQGRVLIGFADGCVNCTSRAASTGEKATIARQSGGKRLFAAFDPIEPTVPKAPLVNGATADALGVVTVTWQEPDNGGSALTGYNVYRKTGTAGTFALLANVPPNRTQYVDSTAVRGTQYFYKVTAVNAVGEGLNCGEFSVGLAGPIETPCIAPGITLQTDPAGDNTTGAGSPSHDIRQLSVSEIFDPALSANKLFFRLKVANGSPLAPESRWTINFTRTVGTPTPTNWFITMLTEVPAGSITAPVFRYGHVEVGTGGVNSNVTDGTLDASSRFLPDGSILLEISRPTKTGTAANNLAFPELQTGEMLSNVKAEVRQKAGVLLALIDDTGTSNYTLVGNAFCRPNNAPTAALSANPTTGDAPLLVNFNASGSSDPDTAAPADTIASYTFNFGDGAPEVTQPGPLVSHTYTTAGNFPARVRVTDSRGMASTNIAQAVITVNAAAANLQYYPLPRPLRLLDTRAGQPACDTPGTPLAGGQARLTQARVTCDGITIPVNAQVLVGNATVDNTAAGSSGGFITLYPGGAARPTVSNLNYVSGQAVPNAFVVGLGDSGAFNIFASSTTNMIIDVTGYYAPPTPTGLYYHPLPRPLRLLDTRNGQLACDAPGQTLIAGQPRSEQARVTCDGLTIPASAKAVVGNATVVNNTGGSTPGNTSFVTLYPTGVARPNASNLNYVAGQIVPNAFTVS
ncbi:MAG: PKD domain-containing protein, partial [Acidobacteriota bacterium]|nr:PKD domain-containing protein [Acidobacteriota bacterium]